MVAFLSQSVGAIVLLLFGFAALVFAHRPVLRPLLIGACTITMIGGAIYLSGVVPLRTIADQTSVGRHIVQFIKSTGRGSFTWRIARSQRALPTISAHLAIGPDIGLVEKQWRTALGNSRCR